MQVAHDKNVVAFPAAARMESSKQVSRIARPAAPLPAETTDLLEQRLAEELACLARHIDQSATMLTQDPAVANRHSSCLVSLDMVRKTLEDISTVVRAANKPAAVDRVRLEGLKRRLGRRSITPLLAMADPART